jgi:hypothetical protein
MVRVSMPVTLIAGTHRAAGMPLRSSGRRDVADSL